MKPIIERLDNGMTVVLSPGGAADVVSYQMWVGAGSTDERPSEEGLAHVFEHMLFKGTERRAVGEIARDVERAGGQINAWTSHDETVFYITLASRFAEQGLDILADAIQHAALDPDELARELSVIREEIRMGEDSPGRVLMQRLFRSVFHRHPYGRPVIGFDRTVRRFTREMVVGFYRRWYRPANMVLVVVGDFETEPMLARVAAHLDAFGPKAGAPRRDRPAEPAQHANRVTHVFRPVSEARVAVGFPIPGLAHPDVPALDLLSAILGQGMSSRLETKVRRELGLASDVRAMAYTPRDLGIFAATATAEPGNLVAALEVVARETARLVEQPVSGDELERARTLLESDAVFAEETVDGVARKLGFFALHAGDVAFEQRYFAAMMRLGPSDLLETARRYLDLSRASIAAVLPDARRTGPTDRRLATGARAERTLTAAFERGFRSKRTGAAASASGPIATEVFTLPTGDIVLVRPDPAARLVAARAAFLGGVRFEPKRRAGIAALLANTAVRGTANADAREIARRMDTLACSIAGFSGRNTHGMSGEFLARNFPAGFELMADCLRRPAFPAEEVARERELILADIREQRDNPSRVAFELFEAGLFGRHPYGRLPQGSEETLRGIGSETLRRFLASTSGPGRMILAVVGGVRANEVRDLVTGFLAPSGEPTGVPAPPAPWRPPCAPKQVARDLEREQSHVIVGFPGTTLVADDRFAVEVLVEILGGHGGRLFDRVRERGGLAYSVTCVSMEGIEPGYVALYAATAPGQERRVVDAMLAEVAALRRVPPANDELLRVKRHLLGSHAIGWQRFATQAASMALDELYGNGHDAHGRYGRQIERVTRAALCDAAERYLDPERMVVACAGPNAESLDLLSR